MSVISDKSKLDLEKCEQTCEGDEIELSEDSTSGKLTYFLAPYFFEKTWISDIGFSILNAYLASLVRLPYFGLRDFYDDQLETKLSDIFSPPWIIIHYFLCFSMFSVNFIYYRKNVNIETEVLRQLLKEVTEMDLTGDPAAWRRIASRINHFSKNTGYRYSVFYSGEHCRRFFVREIVKPIECQTYDIRCYLEGEICRDFWKNPSNKMLVERAIANYNKSVENLGELLHIADEDGCRDDIFENFCIIINNSIFYLVIIELASCVVTMIAFIISMISRAIFDSFAAPQ